MKKSITILALFMGSYFYGQDLPKVIPPSPETAALFKYQEYPVNYSTGLQQISIPLFQIKSGDLVVPISISYHAAGCKVEERDGPIAKGWSLNTGGAVSRTIHGSTDFGGGSQADYPFPYPFNTNISLSGNLDDLEYAQSIMHYTGNQDIVDVSDFVDSEYDIFSYNIGNNSGKLVFKDENSIKTPVLIPPKAFQINPIVSDNQLSSLIFLDDKGVSYEFSKGESNAFTTPSGGIGTTAYKLKKITASNKSDNINYYYQGDFQNRISINHQIVLEDAFVPVGEVLEPPYMPYKEKTITPTTSFQGYHTSRISEITYENGRAVFNLSDNNVNNNNEKLIESIEIYELNNNSQPMKTIKFHRSRLHWLMDQQTITNVLDSITFHDKTGKRVQKYAFEHYPTPAIDNSSTETILNFRYVDWWGYYNGLKDTDIVPGHPNVPLIPAITIYEIGNLHNLHLKEPNLNALKSGVLKKITYPTGGSTEFIYENNKYKSSTGRIKNGPGLRVAQIISEDSKEGFIKRTFKYGTSNDSDIGFIDLEPRLEYLWDQFLNVYYPKAFYEPLFYMHRNRTYHSSFVSGLSEIAQRPIRYTQVTEYKGTESSNTGKTVYEYDHISWSPRTTRYNKWDIPSYNYWNTPMLKEKTDYIRVTNGLQTTYEPQKKLVNHYTTNLIDEIKGLHVHRNITASSPSNARIDEFNRPEAYVYLEINTRYLLHTDVYSAQEYKIPVGTKNLTSSIETIYNNEGDIVNATSYEYNLDQLVSKVTKKHNGAIYETTDIKYAPEFAFNHIESVQNANGTFSDVETPNLYQKMKTNNLMNYEVEKTTTINGKVAAALVSTYKQKDLQNSSESIFLNENVYTLHAKGLTDYENVSVNEDFFNDEGLVLDPRLKKEYSIRKYNKKGKPEEVLRADGVPIVYVWGYNGQYPIAKIENATFTAGKTNTITQAQQTDIDDAELAAENDIDEASEISLQATLKLLQEGFPNAMVTTYTYDPLIGITSMTDPRGYMVYYEYDDSNRLKQVKDAKENIITDNKYHYKNQ